MDTEAPQPSSLDDLLVRIDMGIQSHLEWTQRLLRCAVLRISPGDDFLQPDAHRRCRLGGWLEADRSTLEEFDAGLAGDILRSHERMHAAVRSVCLSVLDGVAADPDILRTFEETQSHLISLLTRLRERLAAASVRRDPLTGLPLRHGLEDAFKQRQKDAARFRSVLHLLMLDIDHFKSVNDTHGHPVGDLALKHVAGIRTASLRRSDVLVRYGGEEFLALLLNADPAGAHATVERLLDAFRVSPLRSGGLLLPLRVTIGIARVAPAESLASAVDRADRALLLGKQAGRDRAVTAPDPPPGPEGPEGG